jgi:hypothetical protein
LILDNSRSFEELMFPVAYRAIHDRVLDSQYTSRVVEKLHRTVRYRVDFAETVSEYERAVGVICLKVYFVSKTLLPKPTKFSASLVLIAKT